MVSYFTLYFSDCFIYSFFREFELKAGVIQPIKLYLFMSETQPLNFSIAAQDLTVITTTENQISMNFATGTEVGKRFDFQWALSVGKIILNVKGKSMK